MSAICRFYGLYFLSVRRMRVVMLLRLLGLVGFLLVASGFTRGQNSAAPVELRVRILDYKTGQPIRDRRVQLTLSGPDGEWRNNDQKMISKTGADGLAVFRIKTIPPRVDVVDLADYLCTFPEEFAAEEILHHGVVGRQIETSFCKPHASSNPDMHAGEVVFYVHRMSFWKRVRHSSGP